jgi:hypothetical protein
MIWMAGNTTTTMLLRHRPISGALSIEVALSELLALLLLDSQELRLSLYRPFSTRQHFTYTQHCFIVGRIHIQIHSFCWGVSEKGVFEFLCSRFSFGGWASKDD